MWAGVSSALEEWILPKPNTKLTGKPKKQFTISNPGLSSNIVTALTVRENDNNLIREVWAGSPNGLSCYRYPMAGAKDLKEKK